MLGSPLRGGDEAGVAMRRIVVIGAGVAGLGTALLLAGDGHDVTVLERDGGAPPDGPEAAWDRWERRGVTQFRHLHLFLARFRSIIEAELPEVARGMEAAGALHFDLLADIPERITGGRQPGDEQYLCLTARRPVTEAVMARVAEAHPGIEVRRGEPVTGLCTGPPVVEGVPNVTGVLTERGETLRAELVVDASGRRSPLPGWLASIGAPPTHDEVGASGFMYYGRHFRSADGSHPPLLGATMQHYGSISILTLPADNGTWAVGIVVSSSDNELRALKDPRRWAKVVQAHPMVAHWLHGQPMQDDVSMMARLEDRRRKLVVESRPLVTGAVSVGDSWACTNPTVGRGASIALLHAVTTRDVLRRAPVDDPLELAMAHHDATQAVVGPWYRSTVRADRHRLAEVAAHIAGVPYETDDEQWHFRQALAAGAGSDPDLLRAAMADGYLLRPIEQLMRDEKIAAKVEAVSPEAKDPSHLRPSRSRLLELVSS
jgi:2-polyprenyl-6-methoxyphenol hydroxylase-like FAD-dependent oxidoreductase